MCRKSAIHILQRVIQPLTHSRTTYIKKAPEMMIAFLTFRRMRLALLFLEAKIMPNSNDLPFCPLILLKRDLVPQYRHDKNAIEGRKVQSDQGHLSEQPLSSEVALVANTPNNAITSVGMSIINSKTSTITSERLNIKWLFIFRALHRLRNKQGWSWEMKRSFE